jgi:hypothetical protein
LPVASGRGRLTCEQLVEAAFGIEIKEVIRPSDVRAVDEYLWNRVPA